VYTRFNEKEELSGRMWGSRADLGARLSEAQAGELFVWLAKQFPHAEDPDRGEPGAMSSRETVGRFRDAIMGDLKDRGTGAAAGGASPTATTGTAGKPSKTPPPGPTPSDESKLRLFVKDHLDKDLRMRGILLNQEVEIRPGEFLDIYYVTVALPGTTGARASVVIEVKGCWNNEVRESMEKQLRDRYLQGASSRHGIYLVGWFLCDRWDKRDYRYRKTPKWDVEDARRFFRDQAKSLEVGATISAGFRG
jgi:hypothetical protein